MTNLSIQQTPEGVVVREQFRGSGDGFTVNYRGTGTFPALAPTYDIRIAGEWQGPAPVRFLSRGVDRIFANRRGVPTSDRIQSLDNKCVR